MEVYNSGEFHITLIPEMRVSCIKCEVDRAYVSAKNAEIFLRTSASSVTVSLNPGVSIRTTG